jgi:hypothetical protein
VNQELYHLLIVSLVLIVLLVNSVGHVSVLVSLVMRVMFRPEDNPHARYALKELYHLLIKVNVSALSVTVAT